MNNTQKNQGISPNQAKQFAEARKANSEPGCTIYLFVGLALLTVMFLILAFGGSSIPSQPTAQPAATPTTNATPDSTPDTNTATRDNQNEATQTASKAQVVTQADSDQFAKWKNDVDNGPTVLTADDCKSQDLNNNLKNWFNNILDKSQAIDLAFKAHIIDIAVYHVTAEVNSDNVVCTFTMTTTRQGPIGTTVETDTGIEIGLAPGRGGEYQMKLLAPGTQTMDSSGQ